VNRFPKALPAWLVLAALAMTAAPARAQVELPPLPMPPPVPLPAPTLALPAAGTPVVTVPHLAPPSPQFLTGIGEITLPGSCPGGFKVPLAGESVDGSQWTFALTGAQATCPAAAGKPIAFQGPWNPSTGCTSATGAECPQSLDPTRPGYIALGPVPAERVITETSLRFCVAGNCFAGSAFVERASASYHQLIRQSVIVGYGELTPPGCDFGALKMPVTAVNDGGPVWLTIRPASLALDCLGATAGAPIVFFDTWNPDIGGCISSVTNPGTWLCIGSVPHRLTSSSTTMSMCFPTNPVQCWSGLAQLMRT
jgi:hypothetical protein